MLDAWIIEELRRKEQHKEERPSLELPLYDPTEAPVHIETEESPDSDRGIFIIDVLGG